MKARKKNTWVLIALALLFFGPVLSAYLLNVFAPSWRPFGQTNQGELLAPARKLEADSVRAVGQDASGNLLTGSWTLVYVSTGDCQSRCQLSLIELRQAHLALGRDMKRLRRVLLFPIGIDPKWELNTKTHPGLAVAIAQPGWMRALHDAVPASESSYVVLIDPQGYAVMRYAAEIDGASVLKDLKRLLRISKIG